MPKIKIKLQGEIVKDEMVQGGLRLKFKNPAYYRQLLQQFKFDKFVDVMIENKRTQRSGNQNRFLHGVAFPIIGELTGYTMMESKKICKKMFIAPKIVEVGGKEIEIGKGTSELGKAEASEFIDSVRQLAVELGGYISTPCEAGYFCMKKECDICQKEMERVSGKKGDK